MSSAKIDVLSFKLNQLVVVSCHQHSFNNLKVQLTRHRNFGERRFCWKQQLENLSKQILLERLHLDIGVESLRFARLANGNATVMMENAQRLFVWGITFTVPRRGCRRMKSASSAFAGLLREQGYSELAVAEICRWYIYSTTSSPSEIANYPKN